MLPVKRNEDLHLNSMLFFFFTEVYSGSSRIPRLYSLYLFVRYDFRVWAFIILIWYTRIGTILALHIQFFKY